MIMFQCADRNAVSRNKCQELLVVTRRRGHHLSGGGRNLIGYSEEI